MTDVNIESLIHALCMAAWDAGAESGTVWCPDADMSKRGVVPMTQDEGFAHAREHFARHGGGSESSAFDQALAALRAELARIKAAQVVVPEFQLKDIESYFGGFQCSANFGDIVCMVNEWLSRLRTE